MDAAQLAHRFLKLYGAEPRVYRAPGRVNLIGEHTDYNDGFVMPMGIDVATWVAVAPREDRRVVLRSENFEENAEFVLDEKDPESRKHWSDYPRGVAHMLQQAGHRLVGVNILLHGEVPVGSGLSSSAALEVSTGYALLDCAGIEIDRLQLALACQRAENEFVGVRSGLMDQFASCFAEQDHALMLDCRSLNYEKLSLPVDDKIVVCNTMVKHELSGGEYNQRRAECEAGVRLLTGEYSGVRSLRDVELPQLEAARDKFPETIFKRCRHVITENARVVTAAAALRATDWSKFGELMFESHRSLRDDYEVSCKELDLMVEFAKKIDGVFGARMTGGGFGGCTVNLVKNESVDEFKKIIARDYEKATGLSPEIYVCSASQGAERVI